jgi:hypothetical protein
MVSKSELNYKEGRYLIDEIIKLNFNVSTFDLFKLCWKAVEKHQDKFRVRAELSEMHESAWRVLVYHDLCKHIKKVRPDFSPPIKTLNITMGPSIFVTVHTGLEIAIAKSVAEKNYKISVVYLPNPQNNERSNLFKLSSFVQFIKADSNCLLNAKAAIENGRHILADCDHPLPENPKANLARGISKAMFELSKILKVDIVFILPFIDRGGAINFQVKSIKGPLKREVDYRLEFISFLKNSGFGCIDWKLSKYRPLQT